MMQALRWQGEAGGAGLQLIRSFRGFKNLITQVKITVFFLSFRISVKPQTIPDPQEEMLRYPPRSSQGLPKFLSGKQSSALDLKLYLRSQCLKTKHFKFKQALWDEIRLCQKNSQQVASGYRMCSLISPFPADSLSFPHTL